MRLNKADAMVLLLAFSILFVLGGDVALAQTSGTTSSSSSIFCNAMNWLYPVATRAIIAIIAVMGCIYQMWNESTSIFVWMKRHQTIFIFAVALIAGPTIAVQWLGTQSSCTFS